MSTPPTDAPVRRTRSPRFIFLICLVAALVSAIWVLGILVIVAGWWLALGHIVTGIAQAITIIGIPLALANWKMVPISLFPLGKQIVPSDRMMAAYGQ